MNEIEVIRLNIERYRRMLQTDLDDTTRRAVQKMLDEFERRLASATIRLSGPPGELDPRQI